MKYTIVWKYASYLSVWRDAFTELKRGEIHFLAQVSLTIPLGYL